MKKKQIMRRFAIWLAVLLLISLRLRFPTDSAALASWYSAIGTVGAVFAAVWATFSTEERLHQEAQDAAVVTSVMVTSTVSHMIEELLRIELELEDIRLNGTPLAHIAQIRTRLEDMPLPTEEQLQRLVHAPGEIALEIASALARVKYALRILSPKELATYSMGARDQTREGARRAHTPVSSARGILSEATMKMVDFYNAAEEQAKVSSVKSTIIPAYLTEAKMAKLSKIARVIAGIWSVLGMGAFLWTAFTTGVKAMLTAWAKSLGWVVGLKLWWTGSETPEGMGLLLANSLGQIVFFLGGILLLLLVKPRAQKQSQKAPVSA
ncbi:hypothetical protein [Variovorax sp. 278MFTsu5.1]|uniref:hypothetical protein n=1 Tax=Variovorax sp. 278MFTsu5.1 TaxID=3158366 RepID=UPI003AACDD4E